MRLQIRPSKIVFFCVLIVTFSTVIFGQAKRKVTLKNAISQYGARTVKALNRTGSMGRYKISNTNTFNSDVDGDGDFDGIVEMFFCEYDNCHPTTSSSRLAVFLNTGGSYRLAVDKSFVLYGKINSVDDGTINIDVYDLDGDDPQCCPEIKRFEKYRYKANRLIKVKR